MNEEITIEARIVAKFLEKLDSDELIPREVARRIQAFFRQEGVKDADAILYAISHGVKDPAPTSATCPVRIPRCSGGSLLAF